MRDARLVESCGDGMLHHIYTFKLCHEIVYLSVHPRKDLSQLSKVHKADRIVCSVLDA